MFVCIETLDTALGCGFSTSDDYLQLWHSYCDYMRRKTDDWSEGMLLEQMHIAFEQFCFQSVTQASIKISEFLQQYLVLEPMTVSRR